MARKRQGAGNVEQRLIRIVERRSPGFGASIKQTQLTLEVIEITMHRQGGRGQHPGLLLASVARENLGDRQRRAMQAQIMRSEEHTSELQSRENLVCRLL